MKKITKILASLFCALTLLLPAIANSQAAYPNRGGTGTETIPTYGKVLVGNNNGTYDVVATSTLGIQAGVSTATYPLIIGGSNISTAFGTTTTNIFSALNTFSGGINLSAETASRIAIIDASKNVISANTTTYPSLTELSYGKGVTSAIQTQLDSKGTFTLPSLTSGSVLFSNGTTIAQDNANFFWNDSNNRLALGHSSPDYTLDVRSSGNIQAWIGTAGSTFGYTIGRSTSNGFLEIFGNQGIFSGISVDQIRSAGSITIAGNAVISNWATTLGLGSGSGTPNGILELRGTPATAHLALGGGASTNYNFLRNAGTGYLEISGVQGAFTGYLFSTGNYSNVFTMIDGVGAVFNETGESALDFRVESDTDANNFFVDASANANGFGTNAPSAKLHIIKTSEQLRVGYDASNYYSETVGSTGGVTLNAVGSGAKFTFSDGVEVPRGGASTKAKVGGSIFDYFTDTTVGGAETDIYSSTLDASLFAINGDKVTSSYGGNFVTVGTELTQLKVYLAGTAIWDSTGVAPTTGTTSWNVDVKLIRVSSTVVRYTVTLNTTGASGFVYAVSGELTGLTLTNTNILKITGTSSGVGSGSGDIIGRMGFVEFKPAS